MKLFNERGCVTLEPAHINFEAEASVSEMSKLAIDPSITQQQHDVIITELYRSNTLAAIGRYYNSDGPVFITFAFHKAEHVPFGFPVFHKYKLNAIYVLCSGPDWYQYSDSLALANAVREGTRSFERVILYGTSMGAYAALMFSGPMQADVVLAVSPQASLDPAKVPFEKRWLTEASAIASGNGFGFDDLQTYLTRTGRIIVVYDPSDDDAQHVALVQCTRVVEKIIIRFARHRALLCLSEMGLASTVLIEASKGTLDCNDIRRRIRGRRRRSGTYCRSVGRALSLKKSAGALIC